MEKFFRCSLGTSSSMRKQTVTVNCVDGQVNYSRVKCLRQRTLSVGVDHKTNFRWISREIYAPKVQPRRRMTVSVALALHIPENTNCHEGKCLHLYKMSVAIAFIQEYEEPIGNIGRFKWCQWRTYIIGVGLGFSYNFLFSSSSFCFF